jgi:ceramide glucosyltransferase
MLQSVAVGYGVVGDRLALRDCWLYPVRDLLGFFLWCGSYAGSTIDWRGEVYRLELGGRMVRTGVVHAAATEDSAA